MFTFRSPANKLTLEKYLVEICYDDPKIRVPFRSLEMEGRDLIKTALEKAVEKYGKQTYNIVKREHNGTCNCYRTYTALKENEPAKFKDCFDISHHLASPKLDLF